MSQDRPKAEAKTRWIEHDPGYQRSWLLLALAPLFVLLLAAAAFAQENITKSHGFSTYGDLKYPADFPHFDYVNPDAPKGGEISVWADGTFDSMNPYVRKGRPGSLASIMFEALVESSSDETGSIYGLVAHTIEYPDSQDWVIFHMRPEATFSNGDPVTAHDVAFSHNLFIEQGLPSYSQAVSQLIQGAEALDDHRVKFTFMPDVPRKNLIGQAGSTPIFSKKWYEETGARLDETRMEPGPGSGPYMLEGFRINEEIRYVRNPDYWGNDLGINQGRNNFDLIRVEYFADSNAAFEGFKSGEYTFRIESEAEANTWATGYNFPAVESGHVVQKSLPDGNLPTALGFVFNLRKPMLQDVRVREALGLMYSFEWSNETLYQNLFARQDSFWEGSDLEATGLPEGRELELLQEVAADLPEGAIDQPAVTFEALSNRQLDRKALRRATALMSEAGWEVGDDGKLRNADGQTLKLEWLGRNPLLDRVINPIVANMEQLGVDITYNRVDTSQFVTRRREFDFDIIIFGYSTSLEPGIGLPQWFGTEAAENSTRNMAGTANKAVDVLMDKVVDATNREDLIPAVRALDRSLRAMRFWVPLWYKSDYWVAHYDMYEHPETLPPYALGYLDFWWYNAEKGEALKAAGALR